MSHNLPLLLLTLVNGEVLKRVALAIILMSGEAGGEDCQGNKNACEMKNDQESLFKKDHIGWYISVKMIKYRV